MQGRLSSWLVKHGLIHRSLGFNYEGIETLQIKPEDWQDASYLQCLIVKGQDTVGQQINVTCEVQQLLGNNRVRVVAMSATDGLMRGMKVIDTGAALSVPVGGATLGRIFNVLGEPIDNLGPIDIRINNT